MTASNSHKRSVAKKHRSGAEFIDEDFIPQRRVTMNTSREKIINATTASVPLAYLDLDFNIAYDDDAHGDDEEPRMVVTSVLDSRKLDFLKLTSLYLDRLCTRKTDRLV